ncbi:MAG TPA: tRNA 2-thiocytidine(32) synthetase TtcA [Thermodesulfobacteriota bacterium]
MPRYASDLERRITRRVGQAIADFGLVEEGDRILVGVSGGKDSMALLRVLDLLRRRSPVRYTLVAGTLDQGYAGFDAEPLRAWYLANGYEHRIVRQEAYDLEGKMASGITLCAFCSRQRRGFLYALAGEVGATKVALGHHADDLVETLLLNQLFGGKIRTMAPKRRSDDGRHVVIRPLAYVWEQDLADYAAEQGFPITACGCPMCGSPELQRKQVKWLLGDLEDRNPGVKETLLRAMANVHVDELLVPPAKLAAGRVQGRITRGTAGPRRAARRIALPIVP